MEVVWSFETLGAIHPTTRRHATADPNHQEDRCESLTNIQLQPWFVRQLTNLKFLHNLIRPYSMKYISHRVGGGEGKTFIATVTKNLVLLFLFKWPMKIEQTGCSETSAENIQTPVNRAKQKIQHSQRGQILESRIILCSAWLKRFRRCGNEICALLGRYAEYIGSYPTFRDNRGPETSVTKYQYTLRNITEERRSHREPRLWFFRYRWFR